MGCFLLWSWIGESNPPSRLGKPLYYRYTNPALREDIIPEGNGKFNPILSRGTGGTPGAVVLPGLYINFRYRPASAAREP